MAGRIIALAACLLCALPFFLVARHGLHSGEPIAFWSGDDSLRGKVRQADAYNREMAALYNRYALAFVAAGAGFVIAPWVGTVLVGLDCTVGVCLAWRGYKRALARYGA